MAKTTEGGLKGQEGLIPAGRIPVDAHSGGCLQSSLNSCVLFLQASPSWGVKDLCPLSAHTFPSENKFGSLPKSWKLKKPHLWKSNFSLIFGVQRKTSNRKHFCRNPEVVILTEKLALLKFLVEKNKYWRAIPAVMLSLEHHERLTGLLWNERFSLSKKKDWNKSREELRFSNFRTLSLTDENFSQAVGGHCWGGMLDNGDHWVDSRFSQQFYES